MARAADTSLARAAARDVVTRLRDAGHTAFFAGGCVRDELLALDPTDYDVATDAPPDRVASLFPRTMLVGAAFGVVLVQLPGATIEVATFRSDGPYSDARRPDRIRYSDPQADAQRRDFTINALFLDPLADPDPAHPDIRGRVIDYVGGLDDLERRVVRAVGDPDQRLAEDHLRALRAVRFTARLSFTLDAGTASAISRHAAELRGVSRERIGEEVRRMLVHPTRAAAAHLLQSLALDAPVLDAPHLECPLPTLAYVGADDPTPPPRYATYLAAWALDRADAGPGAPPDALVASPLPRSRKARSRAEGVGASWRSALRLSNEDRDEFAAVLAGFQRLRTEWAALGVAPRKRIAANGWCAQALMLLKVREPSLCERIKGEIEELRRTFGGIAPEPYITGDDLAAMGVSPGPLFKRVLDAVYDAQLEGRIRSGEQARELATTLCV
jgi:tRNA nucleotidyltransferase/poly(A) polymerase